MKELLKGLEQLNSIKGVQAYFNKVDDLFLEIVITKDTFLKDFCEEEGIKYFNEKDKYLEWLRSKNGKI